MENFKPKLHLYLDYSVRGSSDIIPKFIVHSLVSKIKKDMDFQLSSEIFNSEGKFKSIKEDEDSGRNRKIATKNLKMLNQTKEILTSGKAMKFRDDDT